MTEVGGQVPEESRIELDAVVGKGQVAPDFVQRSESHLLHTAAAHRQIAVDLGDLGEPAAAAPVDQIRYIFEDKIAVNTGDILEAVGIEEFITAALIVRGDIAQDDATLAVDLAEECFGRFERCAVDSQRTLHDGDLRSQQRHTVVRDIRPSDRQVLDLLPAGAEGSGLGIGLDRIAVNAARFAALADERRIGHGQRMVVRQGHALRIEHRIGDQVFDDIEAIAVRFVGFVFAQRGVARNIKFTGHLLDPQHAADVGQLRVILDMDIADDELHAEVGDIRKGFVARNLEHGRNRRRMGQCERDDPRIADDERTDGCDVERRNVRNTGPSDDDAVGSPACGEGIDFGLCGQRVIPAVRVRGIGRIFAARGQPRAAEQCGGRKQVSVK